MGALHLRRGCPVAGGLPGAGPVRPPCGAAADDPGAAGGPCPERGGGSERHEKGSEGPERLRAGKAGGVRRGSGHQAHVPAVGLRIKDEKRRRMRPFFHGRSCHRNME